MLNHRNGDFLHCRRRESDYNNMTELRNLYEEDLLIDLASV